MTEKAIKGFENLYVATSNGEIYKVKGRKRIGVSRTTNGNNYTTTSLYDAKGIKHDVCVHHVIAETFIPNPNNLPCVNHKDGNKHNNKVENLEWVTHSENTLHAMKNGMFEMSKVVPGRENFAFVRGFSQVKQKDIQALKSEILKELGLKTRVSWYNRLYGNVEPKISEAQAIEKIFKKYGIKEVWGA